MEFDQGYQQPFPYQITPINGVIKRLYLRENLECLYNVATQQSSRQYHKIGEFKEYQTASGSSFLAAYMNEPITACDQTTHIHFFINIDGKVISPIYSEYDAQVTFVEDDHYEDYCYLIQEDLRCQPTYTVKQFEKLLQMQPKEKRD